MIVLDTNVLSELMRPDPAEAVLAWMSAQLAAALHVTSISYAEILYGVGLLPEGRRRSALAEQAEAMFAEDFAGRVLGFEASAAPAYAAIAGRRRRAGRRIEPVDAMIAAIAQSRGAAIATRDRDFADCGVPVLDPWGVHE
jgi:predicted nucleic acid-binding protein